MDYKIEEPSPVEKKITVTVSPEEVDAAIMATIAIYSKSVRLDGFRKGKVPPGLLEKRFHDPIYNEARQDLINVHINDIIQKIDSTPLSGIKISGDDQPLQRGSEYVYSMEFETLPKFDLPPYEGLEIEEEKSEPNEEAVNRLLEKLRVQNAKIVPVDGLGPAKEGEIANIDFEIFDEDGKAIDKLKTAGFNLELGAKQALPDFEKIVMSIPSGATGEGKIEFPADFIDPELAGKTVTAKVTVNAVKERQLPELDNEFAKKIGADDMDKLRERLAQQYQFSMQRLHKGEAQQKLLNSLVKMTDFPLPPSLVQVQTRYLLTDLMARLERQGKNLASLGKSAEELIKEMEPKANELARDLVLLLSVAKKENLDVSENEINQRIYVDCLNNGANFEQTLEQMKKDGSIFEYRQRVLADKAMDLIYSRAKVTFVDAPKPEEAAKAEEAPKSEPEAENGEAQAAASAEPAAEEEPAATDAGEAK